MDAVDVQAVAAEHAHPICGSGDTCTDPNHASHEVITDWQSIGSESELSETTANGHYYLTANVVIDEYWRCHNSIVLCLNGHTITFLEAKDSTTNGGVTITSDTTFTLCDCSKNQTGKITGSTRSGVNVSGSTAIFNMYGGKITGNSHKGTNTDSNAYGGGVRVRSKGAFNMYGGEISGNTCAGRYYSDGGGCLRLKIKVLSSICTAEKSPKTQPRMAAMLLCIGMAHVPFRCTDPWRYLLGSLRYRRY